MEVNNLLYTQADLASDKEAPVLIIYEDLCARESIWTLKRRENPLSIMEFEPRSSIP
jgi:hypothetical protein